MSAAETGAETPPAIVGQLVKVMESVGVIGKGQTNKHFNYKFRGIDDALAAVQPALIEHGVVCMPRALSRSSSTYASKTGTMQLVCVEVEYTFTCELDGSKLVSSGYGEGADSADKAVAKAMSACFKMVLFQALCIPTEETPDADREAPQFDHSQRQEAPQPVTQAPPKTPERLKLEACSRYAAQRIKEFEVGNKYDAIGLCAQLTQEIYPWRNKGDPWALEEADGLYKAIAEWKPAEIVDGDGFTDDPPIGNDWMKALHALAAELWPTGDNHTIVHEAAEACGFKSTSDVTESRYKDVRRAIRERAGAAE